MSAPMARPISKTTKFILTLPKSLPAKEVLARAKARGIETSENNVHRVRRLHAVPTKTPSNSPLPAAPKAPVAAKVVAGAPSTKSEFVRRFPLNTPAKQVVESAKAAGIKLDTTYVYKVQSRSKPTAQAKKLPAKGAAPVPAVKSAVLPIAAKSSGSSADDLLRAVAAELGLGRAVEILQSERARVKAVLGR